MFIDSINHGYSDNPEEVDVIVLLGGGGEGRMMKAAELYEDGYADYLKITTVAESDASAQSVQTAVRYGVPESQLILEHDATSTYTNATRTMEVMDEYGFSSALIVTRDYHIKRSELIYDRENDGSFCIKYIPAVDSSGRADSANDSFNSFFL